MVPEYGKGKLFQHGLQVSVENTNLGIKQWGLGAKKDLVDADKLDTIIDMKVASELLKIRTNFSRPEPREIVRTQLNNNYIRAK